MVANATEVNATGSIGAEAAIISLVRREELELGERSTYRRLRRLWHVGRLLLKGVRLGELVTNGRLHAEALAAVNPARSQRLTERAFRREVVAHVRRTRRLKPTPDEARHLLYYVRTHAGNDLERLRAPIRKRKRKSDAAGSEDPHVVAYGDDASSDGEADATEGAEPVLQDLEAWRELLTWFREHFPYNHMQCGKCDARGEILGSVRSTASELAFRASRTELQTCAACGAVTHFPRFNQVSKILQTRDGRCGEYAQVMYQLVLALGWRARLVVDFTDHLFVEVALPVGPHPDAPPPEPNGTIAVSGYRWVHLDPCEAAVDHPKLYAEWGKTHTFLIAFGDGRITDVTPTYARDLNATMHARDLSPTETRRALKWARIVCKLPTHRVAR